MYKYSSIVSPAKFFDFIKERAAYHNSPLPVLEFEGTVKLHGSNCGVFLQDGQIYTQSRNRVLTLDNDLNHFNKFVENNHNYFFNVLKQIQRKIDSDRIPVLFGEWCNDNRKGLGLTSLGALYAVFEIRAFEREEIRFDIVPDTEESEEELRRKKYITLPPSLISEVIEKNDVKVYNIHDFPKFTATLDLNQPDISDMVKIVEEVERECPFSKQLGSIGIGEGVVWTCVTDIPQLNTYGEKMKIKGPKHKVTNKRQPEPVDIEKVRDIQEFVDMVLTQNRLEQGIDYLREFNMSISSENINTFIMWIGKDCMKEEGETMIKSNLDRKAVMKKLQSQAVQWYLHYVENQFISTGNKVKP